MTGVQTCALPIFGREQKAWLKERLTKSQATWKIWGATNGTLDMRSDPQNLPAELIKKLKKPWCGPNMAASAGAISVGR